MFTVAPSNKSKRQYVARIERSEIRGNCHHDPRIPQRSIRAT
jgi:hypothetical protein